MELCLTAAACSNDRTSGDPQFQLRTFTFVDVSRLDGVDDQIPADGALFCLDLLQ